VSKKTNFLTPRYWPIWLIIGLLKLLIKLPYKSQLTIGRVIGWFMYKIPSKMRHTSLVNLRLCYPELSEQEQMQLLRRNFAAVGIGVMEMALGWWASDAKIKQLAHIQGFEYIENALKKSKGVILCSAHFTSLELAGRLIAKSAPIVAMYRSQKHPLFEKITKHAREQHYHRLIQREDIRGMLRCLKDNLCVWYAADIDAGAKNSVFVPFFGVPAASITATSRYAKISGAAVIPVAFYRRDDGSGYDLIAQPALEGFPTDNIEADITRVNQALENTIRQKPDQYLWQYKRFKTRPEGQKRFY